MDLLIALDSSESILEGDPRGQPYHNWGLLKNVITDLTEDLDTGGDTRVGVLVFSDDVTEEIRIRSYEWSRLRNMVEDIQFLGGSTNTGRCGCLG